MTIEHSPFAPPVLGAVPAAPSSGIPTLPPSASPSVQGAAAPPSPPPRLAPAIPSPLETSAPAPSMPAPTTAPSSPEPRTPKRSRTPFIVLAGLAIATVAGAAWFALSTSGDSADGNTGGTPPIEEPAPPPLDIAPQDVSNPLIVPIDDAKEVVAEINDNNSEADALDLLGLDETGNAVPDTEPVVGYRFTWNDGTEESTTITVDATTGNYALTTSNGAAWRQVDGRSYSSTDGLLWNEVDGEIPESLRRLGADEPVRIEQVLDPVTAEYTAATTSQLDDGTNLISAEVDSFAYFGGHPNERLDWMASLGHTADTAVVQPGDIVVVQAELAADGSTIELMTVRTSSSATSYSLGDVLDAAPVIESPL